MFVVPRPPVHRTVRVAGGLLAVILAAAGCGGPPAPADPAASAVAPGKAIGLAQEYSGVDLAECLRIAQSGVATSDDRCPGFISSGLGEAMTTCSEVGGRLVPGQSARLWSLDVNGDGTPELAYEMGENFACDGAPSVFSCGSLGCPYGLYQRQDSGWVAIGTLSAGDVPGLEVLAPDAGSGYGVLRGGCVGQAGCAELTYYRWTGQGYQAAEIEARGYRVDFVDASLAGLWSITRDVPVLKTPQASAEVLDRYPVGTDVVLIGTARGAPYYYVSPCNACESGFIERDAITKLY